MPDAAPLISVCMPVYNTERYVGQAIESILSQTLGDFELLIVDDGSTDGSLEVLRRYADRDSRIRLTTRPNKGVAYTRREMADQSRGEFLACMDADDIALPHRFARQVEYFRAHPECVLVGSRVRLIDPDGDPLCDWCTEQEHEVLDARLMGDQRTTAISNPAVMMRRDAVMAVGNYRLLEVLEDNDMFLRLAEYGRIANLPDVLLQYRIHAANISKAASFHNAIDRVWPQITREARQRRNLSEPGEPSENPAISGSPRINPPPTEEREKWAWWALGAGHPDTARKHARWVLSRAPLSPRSWKLMYCVMRGQ
jgi:glycosyltransferase involved in cell wall biosynthesis